MKGNAVLTIELALNGVDLHGVETFRQHVEDELASELHQRVSAMPGISATVRDLSWTPDQEKK